MKKGWRKHRILIAVAAALVFGILAYWLYVLISVHAITTVANQFKPDNSWRPIENRVVPPKVFCIDETCPSVSKTWSLQQPIENAGEFQKVAIIKGVKMDLLNECFYVMTPTGRQKSNSCDASATLDGYKFWLSYYGNSTPLTINLRVERPY